jgi:hypothetical protein
VPKSRAPDLRTWNLVIRCICQPRYEAAVSACAGAIDTSGRHIIRNPLLQHVRFPQKITPNLPLYNFTQAAYFPIDRDETS